MKEEKEVLFFPFSLFKIISFKKINESNKKEYEITLQLDTINEKPKIKGELKYRRKIKYPKVTGNARRDEFKTKTLLYLLMSILVLFIGICIYFYMNKKNIY